MDHAGLVVVGSQLWAGRVNVVAELDRDRLGDGPVELTSTSGTEHLQGDRPKLVVAEVVGEPLIADDPSTPELVEMVDEFCFTDPGGRDQQTHREGPTDDGRNLGKAPSAVRELAQSGAQHRPNGGSERRLASRSGDPGSKHFDDEEWVALGLRPESCRQYWIDLLGIAEPSGERRGRGFVEPVEGHGGHGLVVAQGVDEFDERMMLWDLLGADGTHDENRCRLPGTDDEADHVDGLGVTPLQIVDDQQTWAVADDGPAHGIEQPMALSQVARPARCGWRGSLEELGEETSELGPPDRAQRVDVAPEGIRSEQVDDWAPRQSARRLVRTSRSHHVALGSNAPSQLQGETGLPDPRFAGQQHEMGPPLPRRVPCLVELVQLEVAAHERRFGDGCHLLALGFPAVGCAGPELSVHRPEGLARFHREVALEHLGVPVVGAQRRSSVAEREMRFHLDTNGRFVGRLQVDDALGKSDRRFVVVAPGCFLCQPHEDPVRLGSKPCSLVQDPVVVASWKQIARIEARRELEIAGSQGVAEPQHVDLARPRRNPPHDLVVDLDELADVGKGEAEVVQQLSEVGARLTFVGVGPELERES